MLKTMLCPRVCETKTARTAERANQKLCVQQNMRRKKEKRMRSEREAHTRDYKKKKETCGNELFPIKKECGGRCQINR